MEDLEEERLDVRKPQLVSCLAGEYCTSLRTHSERFAALDQQSRNRSHSSIPSSILFSQRSPGRDRARPGSTECRRPQKLRRSSAWSRSFDA